MLSVHMICFCLACIGSPSYSSLTSPLAGKTCFYVYIFKDRSFEDIMVSFDAKVMKELMVSASGKHHLFVVHSMI